MADASTLRCGSTRSLAAAALLAAACGASGGNGSGGGTLDSQPGAAPPATHESPDGPGQSSEPPSPAEPTREPPGPAEPSLDPALGAGSCSTPQGVSGRPRTISEFIELLNALPRPTTVACVLESLERPLEVYLTSSSFSAQPAAAERSPRTFLVLDDLLLSVVPDGAPDSLIELGYRTAPGRSIKAEIAFPLAGRVTPVTMIERIQIGRMSMCAGCHTGEQRVSDPFFDTGEDAFESDVIPPFPYYEVDLAYLRGEAESCDAPREPERCAMLSALFDHGEVRPATLWSDLPR